MQRTGAYAWVYATAFFALSIAQATFATSQVVTPYLLGLGELFSVNSIQGRDLSRPLWYYRNWRYHWVMSSQRS
jgi:hypothetical protein